MLKLKRQIVQSPAAPICTAVFQNLQGKQQRVDIQLQISLYGARLPVCTAACITKPPGVLLLLIQTQTISLLYLVLLHPLFRLVTCLLRSSDARHSTTTSTSIRKCLYRYKNRKQQNPSDFVHHCKTYCVRNPPGTHQV